MVGDVEGWGRGSCVFIVDERDGFSGVIGCGGFGGVVVDYYIAGEEIAVAEN